MSTYALFLVGKVWHYRFQIAGQRRQATTRETTKAKAEDVAVKAFEAARLRARGLEPCPTLREVAQDWLSCHDATAGDHHWQSVDRFHRLHLHGLDDQPLNRLASKSVQVALNEHRRDHKPRSCNQWLAILHLLGTWAKDLKQLEEIPWKVKKLKIQKTPKKILPNDKTVPWLAAVDAVSPQAGTAVRLMLGLGLRETEALTAIWEDMTWEAGTYTPGKTKGGEAHALKLPPWLQAYLQERRQVQGWIIPGKEGKPHRRGFCATAMFDANQTCGTPGITPHRLRGTCATRLAAVLPLSDVQKFMRHKDPRTTLGYIEEDQVQLIQAQLAIEARQGLTPSTPRA